jgi:hypothetical protein
MTTTLFPGMRITSLGIASAQGSAEQIATRNEFLEPRELPWVVNRHAMNRLCRPVCGIDSEISGVARWQELARRALFECCDGMADPSGSSLLVASCNGGADRFDSGSWSCSFDSTKLLQRTPWRGMNLPVVSGSCASGLQVLYLAAWMLENEAEEVILLATDILSSAGYENFEALRILSDENEIPWQQTNTGFLCGEAAVALKLRRGDDPDTGPCISGVSLCTDDAGNKGFVRMLESFDAASPQLIVAQGTGPYESNVTELRALGSTFSGSIPLTSPVYHFGHTLGASSLLSLALAHLASSLPSARTILKMPASTAVDGHRLYHGEADEREAMITCRALNGQCGAALLSTRSPNYTLPPTGFEHPVEGEVLTHPLLREIAESAAGFRPSVAPDILFVLLEVPLAPPRGAVIGGRILPSAVLEMTPGFIPTLIARCWGFVGPAICLVGDASTEREVQRIIRSCSMSGLYTVTISIHGTGENRDIDWGTD